MRMPGRVRWESKLADMTTAPRAPQQRKHDTSNRLQRPAGILCRGVYRQAGCEEGLVVVGEREAESCSMRAVRVGRRRRHRRCTGCSGPSVGLMGMNRRSQYFARAFTGKARQASGLCDRGAGPEGEGCGDAGEDHGLRGMCSPSIEDRVGAKPTQGVHPA